MHGSHLLLIGLVQLWLGLTSRSVVCCLVEWTILVIPTLLVTTVLADFTLQVTLALFSLAISSLVFAHFHKPQRKGQSQNHNPEDPRRSAFVSNHRAFMIIFTTIAILAVDFPVFPRRFAKTETFGYGLMDLGVGSFVFSAGLVAPEARAGHVAPEARAGHVAPEAKTEENAPPRTNWSLMKSLKSCLPLLALGLARLASVTITGYHSHVTEYGLHWNFFFTLAAVKLLSSLVLPFIPIKLSWLMSVVLAVFYEGILTFWLGNWIMSEIPRTDLITANREGLCSCLGYLAIYMAGVAWGREILTTRGSMAELLVVTRLLVLWTGIMWLSPAYSTTFFLPPSRRMANYTFFTWIVAYNLTLLSLFLLLDLLIMFVGEVKLGTAPDSSRSSRITRAKPRQGQDQNNIRKPPKKTKEIPLEENPTPSYECTLYRCPTIYEAIDYNGLVFFLLANLGTGAVNLSVATIHTPELPALAILAAYLVTLCLVAKILHRYNVRLKFW